MAYIIELLFIIPILLIANRDNILKDLALPVLLIVALLISFLFLWEICALGYAVGIVIFALLVVFSGSVDTINNSSYEPPKHNNNSSSNNNNIPKWYLKKAYVTDIKGRRYKVGTSGKQVQDVITNQWYNIEIIDGEVYVENDDYFGNEGKLIKN